MTSFLEAGAQNRFKKAGQPSQSNDREGFPMHWQNLKDGKCPKCADLLEEFPHIKALVCKCGFKISEYRVSEILKNMDTNNFSNSFGYSEYLDNPPF